MDFSDYAARAVSWEWVGGDPELQYRTQVDGVTLEILVGDFPEESAYTLLVNGQPAGEFDSWPKTWTTNEAE